MKKLVEIKDLDACYGENTVLKSINLDIYDKDFIGIVGPNGGGKTTLLKIILGLIKPSRGSIRYFNKSKNKDVKDEIGYLPQYSNIDQKFPITVQEVVFSGLISGKKFLHPFSSEDKKKVNQILEKFGLITFRKKPAGELSGGQLQKTLLARAIVSSPSLLILDEPNTWVDSRSESELYEILKEINRSAAILLVSHDLGTISSYIKTIACVNKTLHYHPSNEINEEQLKVYNCPIDIISHGTIPHRVLHKHEK